MDPKDRRAAARVDIDIRATLACGERKSPCRLLNMCEKGFLIEADDELPPRGSLELAVPLPPGPLIQCTVQVRHVNKRRLGALVTEISVEDRKRCHDYLMATRALRGLATPAPAP